MGENFAERYDIVNIQKKISTMNESELTNYLIELSDEERVVTAKLVDKDLLADAFAHLPSDIKKRMIEQMAAPDVHDMFRLMESDEAVDTLQELPSNMVIRLLAEVPKERRDQLNDLLHYPQNSVGSIMTVDYVKAPVTATRSEVLEVVETVDVAANQLVDVYLTDASRELVGSLHVSDLIRHKEEDLTEVINWNPISIGTQAQPHQAADLFMKHNLIVLPVHDSENKLVGLVTADDIYKTIQMEVHDDYARGYSTELDPGASYLDTPVVQLFKNRISWLMILMLGATFTGWVIQSYEDVLEASVVLATYIPILMDSGGNAGSQSSTLLIRSLALGEVSGQDTFKVIWKEFRVALIASLALAAVNFVRITLMDDVSVTVALVVSLTLVATVVMAKVVGGVLPMLADRFDLDPAVMAGPLITTVVDTFSLLIYFKIASVLLTSF